MYYLPLKNSNIEAILGNYNSDIVSLVPQISIINNIVLFRLTSNSIAVVVTNIVE